MEELIEEVIEDFNIPPYFPKSTLNRIGKEGLAYFEQLNNGCSVNLESDFNFRTLLKNYMYYAIEKRLPEFEENYRDVILRWQLETECDV